MGLSTSQRRVVRLLLYAIGSIAIVGLFVWPPLSYPPDTPTRGLQGAFAHLHSITNESLGVEKVFAISLASRLDKRDNIVLGSSVSGFNVEFIDAMTPDQVNPKTYPYLDGRMLTRCNGDIMEDDTDWDVSLKTQLQTFAIAVRALQGLDDCTTNSPYGDDWDILWLGHCGLECGTNQPPDDARLTCTISDGVCSIVYAVSFRGAQRILAALSVNPSDIADRIDIGAKFDVSLGRMCGSGYLRCFAPYPLLTGGYRPAGPATKGSDINGPDASPEAPFDGPIEGPFSNGVMYSTMLNINRLIRGERTVVSTWEDAPVLEVDYGSIPVLGGISQAV
ncbi:hypothetical protein BJX64DRAFT_280868 [Aspergillus heterothallicus]